MPPLPVLILLPAYMQSLKKTTQLGRRAPRSSSKQQILGSTAPSKWRGSKGLRLISKRTPRLLETLTFLEFLSRVERRFRLALNRPLSQRLLSRRRRRPERQAAHTRAWSKEC